MPHLFSKLYIMNGFFLNKSMFT